MGRAVALNYKAHLGIDYFVAKLPEKKRLLVEAFANVVVASFSISVMVFGGFRLVLITFMFGQVSPALGMPMGYVYLSIPVAGIFLTIYSIEFLVETLGKLKRITGRADAPFIKVNS